MFVSPCSHLRCRSRHANIVKTHLEDLSVKLQTIVQPVFTSRNIAQEFPTILKLNCIYLFQLGELMFQFKNGLLPRTFDSKFALNSQVHNYDTRNSKLFHIPKIRTNNFKFSLRYQGPRFYNSLSSDIQSARTMTSFVNGVKTSLIDF